MLKERIYHDLKTSTTSTIARLIFAKGGNWEYSTNGPFLNICGVNDEIRRIKIVDPNVTRVSNKYPDEKYYVKFSELKKAIEADPTHHID